MKKLMALLLLLPLCSCAAVVVGAAAGAGAGYAWYSGNLKDTLDAALPKVDTVTRATLADLGMVGIEGAVDKLKGEITARMADGTQVRIWLKAVDFTSTEIKIRVGTLGDKAVSEQILRHVKRNL